MSDHRTDHEDRLDALLDRGAGARQAFEESGLADCGRCRELFEGHLELAARLDAVGTAERGELARAMGEPAPSPGRAEDALREAMGVGPAPETRPSDRRDLRALPHRRTWLSVAAAAIFLIFFLFTQNANGPDEEHIFLGSDLVLIGPGPDSADFDRFEWSYAGEDNGWYEVIVYPEDGSEPTNSGRVRETVWEPTDEQKRRWGTHIRWTLEVYGGSSAGDIVTSDTTSAWLSQR